MFIPAKHITCASSAVFFLLCAPVFQLAQDSSPASAARGQLAIVARQKDGLHKAAILAGGTYIKKIGTLPYARHENLGDLALASTLIIKAKVISQRSELTAEGRGIVTYFNVKVDEEYKGLVSQGSEAVFVMAGGKIQFPDNTTSIVDIVHQTTPLINHEYIFFGVTRPEETSFRATSDMQSIFELSSDGVSVFPSALPGDPMYEKRKLTQKAFVEEIRSVLSK